jgi:hypothetical protein
MAAFPTPFPLPVVATSADVERLRPPLRRTDSDAGRHGERDSGRLLRQAVKPPQRVDENDGENLPRSGVFVGLPHVGAAGSGRLRLRRLTPLAQRRLFILVVLRNNRTASLRASPPLSSSGTERRVVFRFECWGSRAARGQCSAEQEKRQDCDTPHDILRADA